MSALSSLAQLFRYSLAGLRVLLAGTLLLGVAYPVLVLGVGRVVAPWQASGSLLTESGSRTTDASVAVGSELIAQASEDGLFLPRPSAAEYDALASVGSNLGPSSPELVDSIEARRTEVAEREGVAPGEVPPDALTASASGLDPQISEAYAALQLPRVARAQGVAEDVVADLVADHTSGRTLGVLGEPRVDVLALNLAVRGAAEDSSGTP